MGYNSASWLPSRLHKAVNCILFFLKFHSLHNVDSVDQLFTKRVETERLIGKKNKDLGYDDEYLIQDVMLQWVENYISAEQYDTPAIAHELYSWEIEQEKKHIYLDPGIEDFLAQYPADKTIFLSDFYTSSTDLTELLVSAGLISLSYQMAFLQLTSDWTREVDVSSILFNKNIS